MNEFVKRLYDFIGIYRIFWSQNSHYRYLPIFYRYLSIFYRYFTNIYRYFTNIYRYFIDMFSEIPAQARVLHSHDFLMEKSIFLRFFGQKLAILPIFPLIDLLGAGQKPILRRYIGRKNDFLFPARKCQRISLLLEPENLPQTESLHFIFVSSLCFYFFSHLTFFLSLQDSRVGPLPLKSKDTSYP